MTPPLISIRGVSKRFGGVAALADVTLDVLPGEVHALVGENGAGKSTLMKILSGVIADYDGRLLLRGRPVEFKTARDAQAAGVAIIHQELTLIEPLGVAANIFLGRELRTRLGTLDERAMRRQSRELLTELDCQIDPRTPAGRLRVGDQQLVEIAKALSVRSEILVMDEPTSALAAAEVERLMRVVERLRQRGVTILYISHKMEEIFRLADRITVLRDGRVVRTLDRAATNAREITHLMVGREIESLPLGSPREPGAEVLRVERLSLPWRGHARGWRLQSVSLSVRRGEIVGIAGLLGAGRTELLECLFGAAPETPQGKIFIDGREAAFSHPAQACRAGVALVTEDRKRLGLFAEMNVRENVSLCRLGAARRAGLVSRSREAGLVRRMVTELAIKCAGIEAPIGSLSGGNQQKAILGRWLLTEPKLLLLDDPTRGIDVGAKAELYALIDRLCRKGLGILITSSELPELLLVCDRILVLCEGRLTAEFARAEATEAAIMEAAMRGEGVEEAQPA